VCLHIWVEITKCCLGDRRRYNVWSAEGEITRYEHYIHQLDCTIHRLIIGSTLGLPRLYCYTSTQNTCTWLVQIASRDVNIYALLSAHCWPGDIEVFTANCLLVDLYNCFVLRYNETNSDWHQDNHWNFFPSVHKMLLSIFDLEATFYGLWG